jgi:hypothetical protein
MKRTLTGILQFYGWLYPWHLIIEGQKVNIYPDIQKILRNLNGLSVTFKQELESFVLQKDETSDQLFEFKEEADTVLILLKKKNGNGTSNMGAQLPDAMQWINGRTVTFSFSENSIEVSADPEEKVFTLPFTLNNSCLIPKGKEVEICKIGEKDGCIFSSLNADGEFYCEKGNSPTARILLSRIAKSMSSSHIGNCLIKGRTDDKEREAREFEKYLGEEVVITKDIHGKKAGDKARVYNGYTYGCMGGNETPLVFTGETDWIGTDENYFEYVKK